MSERTMWLGMTSAIALLMFSCGSLLGNRHGRAEMKRWQDNYYAKQRVVEGFVTIPISDWQYLVRESFHPVVTPVPPKKAKPAKRVYWEDSPTGSITLPAEEPPPCIVGHEKNRPQDVCCPAYLEVNDCSWHHGTNPRESAKP